MYATVILQRQLYSRRAYSMHATSHSATPVMVGEGITHASCVVDDVAFRSTRRHCPDIFSIYVAEYFGECTALILLSV